MASVGKKKKDHKILLFGLLGVGAYLYFKNNTATGSSLLSTGTAANSTAAPVATPVLSSIQRQAVINWANTAPGAAAFNAVYPNFTTDEWYQLYDLVFNVFNNPAKPAATTQQQLFWNNWVTKYKLPIKL